MIICLFFFIESVRMGRQCNQIHSAILRQPFLWESELHTEFKGQKNKI